jgi:PIN domain nuclease of toxin-antitoxin system
VRLLLDTHTFLWFITNDPRLSATAKAEIADPANDILISPASYWEVAIKISLGKYPLSAPFESFISKSIEDNGFTILPLEPKHAAVLTSLPFHHRDPFDRMIVAQASAENISIVSADALLDRYGVRRIW